MRRMYFITGRRVRLKEIDKRGKNLTFLIFFPRIDDLYAEMFEVVSISRGDCETADRGASGDVGVRSQRPLSHLLAGRCNAGQFVGSGGIEVEGSELEQVENLFYLCRQ